MTTAIPSKTRAVYQAVEELSRKVLMLCGPSASQATRAQPCQNKRGMAAMAR
jgi:hypothetical protein